MQHGSVCYLLHQGYIKEPDFIPTLNKYFRLQTQAQISIRKDKYVEQVQIQEKIDYRYKYGRYKDVFRCGYL